MRFAVSYALASSSGFLAAMLSDHWLGGPRWEAVAVGAVVAFALMWSLLRA